jgi:ElaB/YqjD/DUF883 family membrane-anchored ribosome-binding protein
MKKVNNKESGGHKIALGVGIATVVAAAAGAYFLYGSTKGPARRKAIKTWAIKMKTEVMEEVEKMQDLSEDVYHSAIDRVSNKYAEMKGMDVKELETTVKQLKGHWKDIKKEAEKALKKGAKLV